MVIFFSFFQFEIIEVKTNKKSLTEMLWGVFTSPEEDMMENVKKKN